MVEHFEHEARGAKDEPKLETMQVELSPKKAVDAVRGPLDPYGSEHAPGTEELIPLETRNALPPAFDEARTRELARDIARRQFYAAGFFRLRSLSLEAERIPLEFCVPYRIGFFGRGTRASLIVMDAVRRRLEDAKARELFHRWLLEPARSP